MSLRAIVVDDEALGRRGVAARLAKSGQVEVVATDATIAQHCRFHDGIEALLFREGLPLDTHRTMLGVARANLGVLQRYLRLRARAFGSEQLTFDAIRVLPPAGARRITVADSLSTIVAASAPLGAEFQARLRDRLARPWAHLAPSPVKRDTYEIFPRVGGAEPVGLMAFREDLPSSRALAGLAALLVTFASMPPERSFDRWIEDTGIYSNSILEARRFLHDDYVIAHAPDERQRLAALINALDALSGAFFRYALVSEFESLAQEQILKGETPSGARLSELYLALLRRYYGGEGGAVKVDEMFARDWITQRVSFLSFEMMNFPLAAAAAAQLVEKARAGDPQARSGFLDLLGRGEIDLSYPLLKSAGADLASSEPYEAVIRRMNSLIESLSALIAKKKEAAKNKSSSSR